MTRERIPKKNKVGEKTNPMNKPLKTPRPPRTLTIRWSVRDGNRSACWWLTCQWFDWLFDWLVTCTNSVVHKAIVVTNPGLFPVPYCYIASICLTWLIHPRGTRSSRSLIHRLFSRDQKDLTFLHSTSGNWSKVSSIFPWFPTLILEERYPACFVPLLQHTWFGELMTSSSAEAR